MDWKAFSRGFRADELSNFIISLLGAKEEQEREREKQVKDRETATTIFQKLLQPDLTKEQQFELWSNMPQQYWGLASKLLDQQKKDSSFEYDYSDPNYIYKVDKQTKERTIYQEGNPFYRKKIIGQDKYYDTSGKEKIRFFYEDGSFMEQLTGGIKTETAKEEFNENDFNGALESLAKADINLKLMHERYKTFDYGSDVSREGLGYRINKEAQINELRAYSLIENNEKYWKGSVTPLKIINKYYEKLREIAKQYNMSPEQYERLYQDKMRAEFDNIIKSALKGDKSNYSMMMLLKLWANFKFGYVDYSKIPESEVEDEE